MATARSLNPNEVKEVADRLWDDISIIDDYLEEHSDGLKEQDAEIIRSWKRCIPGRFVMERHLKKGSIFISMEDEQVYQVSGIISSWDEMFPFEPMPLMMEVTLIPFKDVIISDGLVMPYNIVLGSNIARYFKDVYMKAKKSGTMRKTL